MYLTTIKSSFIIIILLIYFQGLRACKPNFFYDIKRAERHKESHFVDEDKNFNISEVTKEYLQHCECGTIPDKAPRISGGEEADKFEFPWQAAIVYRNTRIPFCAGTLINNFYVLTAAHCVLNLPKILMAGAFRAESKPEDFLIENDFQVLLSAHKLIPLNQNNTVELYRRLVEKSWHLRPEDQEKDFDEGTLRFDISKRIFHKGFVSEYRKFGFDYDVALLRLKTPVNLTDRPNAPIPICLPQSVDFDDYERLKATTIGWGRTDFRDSESGSPVLKKLQVPVYSIEECSHIAGVTVSSRFICAGHQTKTKDIGKTDSGGPLLMKERSKFMQIGIVSWGAGQKDGYVASAFTRVTEFLPWIFSKLKSSERERARSSTGNTKLLWCSESKESKRDQSEPERLSLPVVLNIETTEIPTTTELEMEMDSTTIDIFSAVNHRIMMDEEIQ